MNWKVGDLAIVISSRIAAATGAVCEVVEITPGNPNGDCHVNVPGIYHSPGDDEWSAYFTNLKPIPPANETTTWSECVWQPKELVMVESI